MRLYLDFETRSEVDIKKHGMPRYAESPSTEALFLAYAFDDGPVQIWEIYKTGKTPPKELLGALCEAEIIAFNSAFERYIFSYVLNIRLEASQFRDPQVSARYLSLPGNLEEVAEILKVPIQKDKRGKKLIDLFSKPRKKTKKDTSEHLYNDWTTHPEEWAQFIEYGKCDVEAMREIVKVMEKLEAFPLPESEQELWVIDQEINDRGWLIDVELVKAGFELGETCKELKKKKIEELTGIENSNSNAQMLAWLQTQGYEAKSLRAPFILAAREGNKLTPLAQEVLKLRDEAASSSYKKLKAMLDRVSADGRLRHQFTFMGSPRCGRWSGSGGVQLQNLARSIRPFDQESVLIEARIMIIARDYEGIEKRFGSVLLTLKYCIRTTLISSQNAKLLISDLNAIETRVAARISGCKLLAQVFEKGLDPYVAFASKMYSIPYDLLMADLKSPDESIRNAAKTKRQMAKAGLLGCVYQLGGGGWETDFNGDLIRTGLFGYAYSMGIAMTTEEANDIVRVFRETYPEIVDSWKNFHEAAIEVAEGQRKKRAIGPDGMIKLDKISYGDLSVLRAKLPSGRCLHYFNPRVEPKKMKWKNRDGSLVYRDCLFYDGQHITKKIWGPVSTSGGKLFENFDQGIARDILGEGIRRGYKTGIPFLGHAHDELIAEQPDDECSFDHHDLEILMSQPMPWAPDLALKAEGFSAPFYRKG